MFHKLNRWVILGSVCLTLVFPIYVQAQEDDGSVIGPVVFEDDFSDNATGWETALGSEVAEGVYAILVAPEESLPGGGRSTIFFAGVSDLANAPQMPETFLLEIDATVESDTGQFVLWIAYGIKPDIFETWEYQSFSINSAGQWRFIGGDGAAGAVPDGFTLTTGTTYRLAVRVAPDAVVLTVDGLEIARVDSVGPVSGTLGLGAGQFAKEESTVNVQYDNLVVRALWSLTERFQSGVSALSFKYPAGWAAAEDANGTIALGNVSEPDALLTAESAGPTAGNVLLTVYQGAGIADQFGVEPAAEMDAAALLALLTPSEVSERDLAGKEAAFAESEASPETLIWVVETDQAPVVMTVTALPDEMESFVPVIERIAASLSFVPPCTISAGGSVNTRTGPGTTFEIGSVLSAGQTLDADGQTVGADGFVWWHLIDGNWVRSDVVSADGECELLPQLEQ